MRRFLLFSVTLAIMGAFAAPSQAQYDGGGPGKFYLDPVDDGCWGVSIDPDSPCYSGKGYPGCTQGTDFDTCFAYCDCGYKYNEEKCDGKTICLELAKKEKQACEANCIADFAP